MGRYIKSIVGCLIWLLLMWWAFSGSSFGTWVVVGLVWFEAICCIPALLSKTVQASIVDTWKKAPPYPILVDAIWDSFLLYLFFSHGWSMTGLVYGIAVFTCVYIRFNLAERINDSGTKTQNT